MLDSPLLDADTVAAYLGSSRADCVLLGSRNRAPAAARTTSGLRARYAAIS
jgi:hypothetical protein